MNRYLIVFVGRSGGTWLQRMLNAHPEVYCGCEVFDQEKAVEILKSCWYHNDCRGARSSGTFIKYQLVEQNPGIMEAVKKHHASVICLQRENVIKHALSVHIGDILHRQIGSREIYDDRDRPGPVHLDLDETLRCISKVLMHKFKLALWANLNADFFVKYEDILASPHTEYQRLCKFLRVARVQAPEVSLKKITSDNLTDAIENYNDVAGFLHHLGFWEYLCES